ncbi:response regulator transcription factor [Pseudomonas fulva]|nr:response regulator transcription factor [Pseudomonas fulva]
MSCTARLAWKQYPFNRESNVGKSVSEVKVLIIDDRHRVVEALAGFLESNGYACVRAADSAQGIASYQADPHIGLVICALQPADEGAAALIQALRRVGGGQRVFEAIMLADAANEARVLEAMRAGFADYYQCPPDFQELLAAVGRQERAILERRSGFQELGRLNRRLQELASCVEDLYHDLERARGQGGYRRAGDPPVEPGPEQCSAIFDKLSPRQLEVARLVGQGKTNYQIACDLGITENTVKLYVSQVLRLTHMHNRTQLALALAPGSSPIHRRLASH